MMNLRSGIRAAPTGTILGLAISCLLVGSTGWRGHTSQDAAGDDLKPGLRAEFFPIGEEMDDFPSLGARKPAVRRIDPKVDFIFGEDEFAGTGLTDYFYARWVGVIRVPKDALYTFRTESDDGSRLYIDGKLVVDNGGVHAPLGFTGKVKLKAGDHAIKIDYFENDRGATMRAFWEFEGRPVEIIPPGVLFHKPAGKPRK